MSNHVQQTSNNKQHVQTDNGFISVRATDLFFPYPIFDKPSYLQLTDSHSKRTVCYDINEDSKDDLYAPPNKKRKLNQNKTPLNCILAKEAIIEKILKSHIICCTPNSHLINLKNNSNSQCQKNAFADENEHVPTKAIVNSNNNPCTNINQNKSQSMNSNPKKLLLPATNPFTEHVRNNKPAHSQTLTPVNPTIHKRCQNAFADEAPTPCIATLSSQDEPFATNSFVTSDYGMWNDDIQSCAFANDMYCFTPPPFSDQMTISSNLYI